jgi:aspartyl/asparaginyl beta-hydroxylase (cupin superfamily)
MLLFDTSLLHRAANEADRMRYILMLRVFHPGLAPAEVRERQRQREREGGREGERERERERERE